MEQQDWPRSLLDTTTGDVYDALIALWLEGRYPQAGFVHATPSEIQERLPRELTDVQIAWAVWQLGQNWVEMPRQGTGVLEAPLIQVISRRRDSRGIRRWTYRPCGVVRRALNQKEEAA